MSQRQSILHQFSYYTASSIIGRLFNVMLLPLYTAVMPPNEGEYGMMTSLYGWGSLATVILSMGLETAFLRIANKNDDEANPSHVYSTAFIMLLVFVTVFALLMLPLSPYLAYALGYPNHADEVQLMSLVVCGDVMLVLPYCYLRYRHQVAKYATCRALYAIINALLCFVVLYICPRLQQRWPDGILWEFYLPNNSLNYVLGCNLITCIIMLYVLIEEWKPFGHFHSASGHIYRYSYIFDARLARQMLRYALPILGASLIDIGIQTIDRLLYLYLIPGSEGMRQLGIYGACFRIGMIMALATQVLRDISEPILFHLQRSPNLASRTGSLMIRGFIIGSIFIFLTTETFMNLIQEYLLRDRDYWEGIRIIPILMCSEIIVGLQFYMSFWYKLTDQPQYGTWFAAITLLVIVTVNLLFVPTYGYIACAWAIFAGCIVRLALTIVMCYVKRSPYKFNFSGYRYFLLGGAIYFGMCICPDLGEGWTLTFKLACVAIYIELVFLLERSNINNMLTHLKQHSRNHLKKRFKH